MFYWLRQSRWLLLVLLVIVAFPGVVKTPVRLSSMYQDFWLRREALRRDWRTEGAGESVLPAKVQTMLALLRDNGVRQFRYSEAIAKDPDASVVQRIAESAYPVLVRQDARHLLSLASEPQDPRCKLLAGKHEVVLAHCP